MDVYTTEFAAEQFAAARGVREDCDYTVKQIAIGRWAVIPCESTDDPTIDATILAAV